MYKFQRLGPNVRKLASLSVLDSAFIQPSTISATEPQRLTNEPYYVSQANQKSLKLISAIQLDHRLGTRNVLLAGAHPGSTKFIQEITEMIAQDTNSNIQLLDYQLICRTIKKFEKGSVPELQWNLNENQIKFTEAFSPGVYEIRDDPFEEEPENDTDIDDDDLEEDSTAMNFRFPRQKQSKINFNITVQNSKEDKEEKVYSISDISITSPESENSKTIKEPLNTPYDVKITNEQICSFLDTLHESIRSKAQGKEKFMILLKDINDLLEGSNDKVGEKLVIGLTQLVSKLRSEQISCILVVGSCPAITDSKNVSKDVEFYTQIIEGSVFTETEQRTTRNMAMDGTIFDTPLDSALDLFEKIELLPPSAVYLSLQKPRSKKHSRKDIISNQQKLRQYLLQLETDLEIRIAQVNCASIIDICDEKGIRVDDALLQVLKAGIRLGKGRKVDSGLVEVISSLTKKVWPLPKLERLVLLATGCQKGQTEGSGVDIGPKALVEALGIIYETDISRFAFMPLQERENRVTPTEMGGGMDEVKAKEPEKEEQPKKEPVATPESVATDLKRRGIKLNTHEKRVLSTVVNPENIKVGLADLILPSSTKLVLQTIVTLPLLRPEFFSKGVLSRSSIHGVLLFGPPGTGKTMLAKAIAKCSGAWFLNVSLSDIFDKYVGEGEKNVRAVFTLARKLGGPVVIFLDEVDAVFGTRRSDGSGSSRREVMNEFMAEWDGLSSKNDGIVVLGATNRPFDLDDAILRRMPRRILIDLPNEESRKLILESNLNDETLEEDVDLDAFAKRTNQYSGSDLKNVCVAAALARVKEMIAVETNMATMSEEELKKHIDGIQDWGTYLSTAKETETNVSNIKLKKSHLEIGLSECPPSLTDETQTLIELRKWDSQHGDGAAKRKKKANGYGFDVSHELSIPQ